MSLKVGDRVAVLDDNITGVITVMNKTLVTIETLDGFEMDFYEDELIKEECLSKDLFSETSLNEVIAEKEAPNKRKPPVVRTKDKQIPPMEVDLHIHQLTTSYKNLSNHDMLTLQLDTDRRQLEFAIKKRIQRVVFIHGVGEGVLRMELEYLFSRYDNVKFYDADYQKYGLGATEVYIFQNTET